VNAEGCVALVGLVSFVFLVATWVVSDKRRIAKQREERRIQAEEAEAEAQTNMPLYVTAWERAQARGDIPTLLLCGDRLVKAARRWEPVAMPAYADVVYRDFLGRLKTNPEIKTQTLEMGRIAYGSRRQDGLLTVYDEEAIRNDILFNG